MRRLAQLLPLTAMLLLSPDRIRAQDPDPIGRAEHPVAMLPMQSWGQAISMPVLMALKEWDTLHLTPEQVQQMRDIQERISPAFYALIMERMQSALPPSVWWSEEPVDEAAVRASFRRIADQEATLLLHLIRARDEVYAVLDAEQAARLRELQRQEVEEKKEPLGAARRTRPCIDGGAGGGFELSPRAEVQYSVEFRGDSLQIGVVFVARAEEKLYETPSMPSRPTLPDSTRFLSGGTAGRWYLQYDERNHVAWVDTQRVALGDDNVVLVDGIESLHEPPRVVGTLRIPSSLYTGGCRDGTSPHELLRAYLEQVPEIRAFVGM